MTRRESETHGRRRRCELHRFHIRFDRHTESDLGSQKGLSHFLHWEIGEFALGEESRVSQLAPATFDVSLRDILAPLLAGGTLCIPPDEARTDSRRLLTWLEAAKVSLIHCVPSLFRQLMAELGTEHRSETRLLNLTHLLLAGEPLYGADIQRWHALMGSRIQLTNLYGPSETTLAKAFHRITETPDEPARMVPVGKPLPNSALLIIKNGELCDPGEIGDVFIKTPFMSKGYLDAPDLMAESFIQNPLTPTRPISFIGAEISAVIWRIMRLSCSAARTSRSRSTAFALSWQRWKRLSGSTPPFRPPLSLLTAHRAEKLTDRLFQRHPHHLKVPIYADIWPIGCPQTCSPRTMCRWSSFL